MELILRIDNLRHEGIIEKKQLADENILQKRKFLEGMNLVVKYFNECSMEERGGLN